MGERLFAINVLAGVHGVDGQRGVQTVRRGDAHHIDVRIGQERLVLHIHLRPAGLLARGLQARAVDVADGHRLGHAFLLHRIDDVEMCPAAAAGADESHANPLVGPFGALGGDGELGLEHRSRGGRGGRGAQKVAAIGNRSFLGHGRTPGDSFNQRW